MKVSLRKTSVQEIKHFREQYLNELNCQIRYDACHVRGWSDTYMIQINERDVGYASVKGRDDLMLRDAIFEVYVLPDVRYMLPQIYQAVISEARVKYLECQSNDPIHTPLVFKYGENIDASTILFAEDNTSQLQLDHALVRPRESADPIFEKNGDAGAYVLTIKGNVVASGGFLLHYNKPFADLYMETQHEHRNRGYASYILQEIKKYCYKAGRIPAARCSVNNPASKAALLKAGMQVCGHMLTAKVKMV